MSEYTILLLSVFYIYIGFVGLLLQHMKPHYHLLLLGYLLVIYSVFEPVLGQMITLPLVLVSITIVYFGCNHEIWAMIFSLTGYLLAVLANHICSVPLSLCGISLEAISTQHPCAFLTVVSLTTIALQFVAKKYFFRPKLPFLQDCPKKLQLIFLLQLLMCVALMSMNFIYGEYTNYPTEVLSFNGLIISIFTVFTIVLFYCLYQLLQENYELRLHRKEQELMKDYTEKIESFYDEFRIFRHDYKNILSTLGYYIEEQNFPELQKYFQEKILPSKDALSSDKLAIGKLHLVAIPSVKSLLYTKLLTALNKGISMTFEITESLTEVSMDEMDLSRILGILIDNALEAAVQTEDKLLSIAIITTDDSVLFSIKNSCQPIQVPLSKLSERGYTDKENHDGLGLYTVQNIVDSLNNVTYIMQYDGFFHQTLEITNL